MTTQLYKTIGASLFVFLTFFLIIPVFFNSAVAQALFDDGIKNPFGTNVEPPINTGIFHSFTDIDGDGDLDDFASYRTFMSPCWIVTNFEFYENQGTPECPEFVKIPFETFGLPFQTAAITFVDIDNDGDEDAFISDHCWAATVTYHENTGNVTDPQFNSTPTQVINTDWGIGFTMFAFGDLDGDGDYDALVNGLRDPVFKYVENTGTPEVFNFATPADNPFGLSIPAESSSEWSQFVDWDCDGDLDILNSHWLPGSAHDDWRLYLYENNGSPTAPSFSTPLNTGQLVMANALGDMDGDGDVDVFTNEYYYRNSSATGCVTLPEAAFSVFKDGLELTFINESSGQATDCNDVTYLWDFGDGSMSDEEGPTHTYAATGNYNVCLTIEDIAGETTLCEEVNVTLSAVGDRNQQYTLFISPNPATDYLIITVENDLRMKQATIEVFNLLGKTMNQKVVDTPDFTSGVWLPTDDLPDGTYYLRISDGEMAWNRKFVKAR